METDVGATTTLVTRGSTRAEAQVDEPGEALVGAPLDEPGEVAVEAQAEARADGRAERAVRAREALTRAERLTGARSVRAVTAVPSSGSSGGVSPGGVSGSPVPAADDEPARPALITTDRPPMAVPPALAPLLPDGLRRGGTTAVEGSTSLVLTLLAHACAHGAWVAVVGRGDLGVLAAAQSGLDLRRLAMVPAPGPDAPAVIAALLDGVDVVVVGPGARLVDADRRRLSARARDRGSVLLPTYAWPGAGVTLVAEGGRWAGVGEGDGWLRAHRLRVVRRGRGIGGTSAVDLVLPLGAADWAAAVEAAPGSTVDVELAEWGDGAQPALVGAAGAGSGLRLVG